MGHVGSRPLLELAQDALDLARQVAQVCGRALGAREPAAAARPPREAQRNQPHSPTTVSRGIQDRQPCSAAGRNAAGCAKVGAASAGNTSSYVIWPSRAFSSRSLFRSTRAHTRAAKAPKHRDAPHVSRSERVHAHGEGAKAPHVSRSQRVRARTSGRGGFAAGVSTASAWHAGTSKQHIRAVAPAGTPGRGGPATAAAAATALRPLHFVPLHLRQARPLLALAHARGLRAQRVWSRVSDASPFRYYLAPECTPVLRADITPCAGFWHGVAGRGGASHGEIGMRGGGGLATQPHCARVLRRHWPRPRAAAVLAETA